MPKELRMPVGNDYWKSLAELAIIVRGWGLMVARVLC